MNASILEISNQSIFFVHSFKYFNPYSLETLNVNFRCSRSDFLKYMNVQLTVKTKYRDCMNSLYTQSKYKKIAGANLYLNHMKQTHKLQDTHTVP